MATITPLLVILALSSPLVDAQSACTGPSAALPQSECTAWQNFYNETGGTNWQPNCNDNALTPCSCALVDCDLQNGHITALYLTDNGLTGHLPSDFVSQLPMLKVLRVDWNKLRGALPDLPWKQLQPNGCCLTHDEDGHPHSNHFTCPLPDGAKDCQCGADHGVKCTN